ncbi:MAG: V-type ATPase subunit subunit G family protein [Methanoregula sp.]|jgi:hypothetical protein
MDQEKTLLQQIREKELEYAGKIEAVKTETDAAIAAAESEVESLLCTADSTGKIEAEQLYRQEIEKIEVKIDTLKREAATARENAVMKGEKNLPRAITAITSSVNME